MPSTCTDNLIVTAVISVSSRSTVYLGYFDSVPDKRVVLKVGALKLIMEERQTHKALASLQGDVISTMMACSRGRPEPGSYWDEMSILVLEHAGTAIAIPFYELPRSERCVTSVLSHFEAEKPDVVAE